MDKSPGNTVENQYLHLPRDASEYNKSKVRDLRQSLRKAQMIYFQCPFHSVSRVNILLNSFFVFVEILVARVVDNII